jgi:hypothetical protein
MTTTNGTAIRDAAFTRAVTAGTYATTRKVDMPTLTGTDLPALSVFMMRERMKPDGDANVAAPRFVTTCTIGISVIRGFDDPVVTDGEIDADVDAILDILLRDLTFVGVPPAGIGLFEGVTRIDRQRLFAQQGETYFVETRLELDFEYRAYFDPIIIAPLLEIAVSLAGEFVAPILDFGVPEGSQYLPGLLNE